MTEMTAEKIVLLNKQRSILKRYKSAIGWFWSVIRRFPVHFGISAIIIGVSSFFATSPFMSLGKAVDILLKVGIGWQFTRTILIMIGMVIGSWLLFFLGSYIWSLTAYKSEMLLRQEFFEVVEEHSMAFHDSYDSGQTLSIGMNEISQVRIAYHPGIRMLLSSFFSIAITSYFLLTIDSVIGITVVVSFIIYLFLAWKYAARVGPIRRQLSQFLAETSAASQEVFRGIEVVRSFDNHAKEILKFEKLSLQYANRMRKEGYLSSFYWPSLLTIIATAFSFIYGLYFVSTGRLTTGQLTQILSLLLAILSQNLMIPFRIIMVQAGLTNAKRIWKVMSFQDPLQEPSNLVEADWDSPIIFDHVTFKYPNSDRVILEDVSFEITLGSKVVLVGGPGSGKSTILKLLLRLYDPTEGSIKINGYKLSDLHTKHIRKHITMVEQDIFLFSDTIKNNIAFAKPDATNEEIKIAAKRAQIADFIESLPNKYDTIIGERGVTLSGGQRQRIAIARALLSNPKVLLLDDSTSNVDIKTEIRIRKAMRELMEGRTAIIVTQRVSTLVEADMIIVLDKGKVVDIGKHEELLSRCPEYQFMCKHLPIIKEKITMQDFGATAFGGRKR